MEKRLTFQKNYSTTTSNMKIIFSGMQLNDNCDEVKQNEILDKCMNGLKNYNDLVRIVSWIRTIFKNWDEKFLEIQIFHNGNTTILLYEEKKLKLFEQVSSDGKRFLFKEGEKINFDNGINSNNDNILNMLANRIEQIKKFKNISELKLNEFEQELCDIYYLFYNENPDFLSDELSIKMQMMVLILKSLNMNNDYSFASKDRKVPICYEIVNFVNKMQPLGKLKLNLSERDKKAIKIIGQKINDYISKSENQIDELIKMAIILFDHKCGEDVSEKEFIKQLKLSNFCC